MNEIENLLSTEKKQLDNITVPKELEEVLKTALKKQRNSFQLLTPWKLTAAAVILLLFSSYHYNAFAYYGKKILGFDTVSTNTINELNNAGNGQKIEQSYMLDNGTEFTINGIISDSNQLLIYYTLKNENGLDEFSQEVDPFKIKGLFTDSNFESSIAQTDNNNTELKGMMKFEPASAFAKKLKLSFFHTSKSGQMEMSTITFPYNPNKALQTIAKLTIKKTVKVDEGTITFDSLQATPTSTVVKGTLNVKNFDRLELGLNSILLFANDTKLEQLGSSITSTITGTKFEIEYDALPKNTTILDLTIKKFIGYEELDESIPLHSLTKANEITISDNNNLEIKKIAVQSNQLEITISTEKSILLNDVKVKTDSFETPLKTTINQIERKQNEVNINERTLVFNTSKIPDFIYIGGMYYEKDYDVNIPINLK